LAAESDVRTLAAGIARMPVGPAQARALVALATSRLSDPDAIEAVARIYPASNSAEVQNAIAGVLIRADYSGLDRVELAQTLRQYRVKSRGSDDLVDALIRRLEIH
jgi:hypothetical protein